LVAELLSISGLLDKRIDEYVLFFPFLVGRVLAALRGVERLLNGLIDKAMRYLACASKFPRVGKPVVFA
jgi:hypothetical protein